MKNSIKYDHELCASGLLEHPRYFPRQLITPTEMTLEHTYIRDKLRRHNRLLHGWGVVCGARVCTVPKPDGSEAELWKVRVKPGYILGPYGDEIVVDCERTVDLRTTGVVTVCGELPGEPVDPWCSEVFVKRQSGPLYVAVKYKEVLARPVRVQPIGCSCEETQCEYSRWCDGYEIGLLPHCPESHQEPSKQLDDLTKGPLLDCLDCPSDPWVVLARVDLDAEGVIQAIENCFCRRLVVSFNRFWWQCEMKKIKIEAVRPEELETGQEVKISVSGENFDDKAEISLGSGVTIQTLSVKDNGKMLDVIVDIAQNAAPGPRDVRITNPDCSTATTKISLIRPAPVETPRAAPPAKPQPGKPAAGRKKKG